MRLEPLRQAYLSRARAAADSAVARAREEATRTIAAAGEEADRILESARHEGRSHADLQTEQQREIAGRKARAGLLAARREAYQSLQRQALRRAMALRQQPEYRDLLVRLEATARRQLGNDAEIDVDPPAVGGVKATDGRRQVDYSLPALVQRSLAHLGMEVEGLWR